MIQHSSLIFHSLLKCLETKSSLRSDCRNCIIDCIIRMKNQALIYLPQINQIFTKLGLKNTPKYSQIIEHLKSCGGLESLEVVSELDSH